MTVFARGYRAYEGSYVRGHPALAIATEAMRWARSTKAFKRIAVFYLIWFVIWAFMLYLWVGTDLASFGERFGMALDTPQDYVLLVLKFVLSMFYGGVALLTALLAIFVGAGLIADDLAAGALPLYLVRPIRGRDYVTGKALVVPGILLYAIVLPGLFFYLLVSLWQPPGEAWSFFFGNLEVLGRIGRHYLLAAMTYSGILLFLSSRTSRRGAVAIMAAAVVLGGVMVSGLSEHDLVGPTAQRLLKLGDLVGSTVLPIQHAFQDLLPEGPTDVLPSEVGAFLVSGTSVLTVSSPPAGGPRAIAYRVSPRVVKRKSSGPKAPRLVSPKGPSTTSVGPSPNCVQGRVP